MSGTLGTASLDVIGHAGEVEIVHVEIHPACEARGRGSESDRVQWARGPVCPVAGMPADAPPQREGEEAREGGGRSTKGSPAKATGARLVRPGRRAVRGAYSAA